MGVAIKLRSYSKICVWNPTYCYFKGQNNNNNNECESAVKIVNAL